MLKLLHYDEIPIGDRPWLSDHNVITLTQQLPIDDNVLSIN